MRQLMLIPVLALAATVGAAACQNAAELPTVSVDEAANLLASKAATAIDANNERTRGEFGIVPGAVLLTSYDTDAIASELPSDKGSKLLFYCSSESCAAAPKAALKAAAAGYTDVAVMTAGIKGWKQAGHPTTPLEEGAG